MKFLGAESSLIVGIPISEGVDSLRVVFNQKLKDCSFHRTPLSSLEECCVSGGGSSQDLEPLSLEGFHVEGLMPRKMVKVHSVLESLRIRIVKESEKGLAMEVGVFN